MKIIPFRRLALAAAAATLVLTTLGALVRATGSGLGCRDEWPACAGGWIAPLEFHAVIEYAHRAVAGLVVVLLIALAAAAWRWTRKEPSFLRWSLVGLAVVVFQALLGRLVVTSQLHGALVTAHYVTALGLVAITTRVAVASYLVGRPRAEGVQRRVLRLAVIAVALLVPLLVAGAYVREKGAGLAFQDWPLMGGSVIPSLTSPGAAIHFVHRILALALFGHIVGLTLRVRRDPRAPVRALGGSGAALIAAQIIVGGANVLTRLAPAAVLAHAALSFGIWAAFVGLIVAARRGAPRAPESPAATGPSRLRHRVLAYAALTKPRIIVLLLVTTVPAMVLAAAGLPSLWLVAATLAGGVMTAGSANALNQYLERDIDAQMDRTRSRPLPMQTIEPRRALVFAIALGIAGFVWLTLLVNLLSALLAASAIAFYVLVYTVWLKRSTPQNIVIGGAAGAVPVLVGWAAVTGTVEAPAWVMFAIVFLWTPPHFWALAMRYRDDYERAGVPMLPVVKGTSETTAQVLLYATVLVAATLVMSLVGGLGALYAVSATALGLGFLYRAVRLRVEPNGTTALKLFRYSVTYLALLFAAMAVDRVMW